MAASTTARRIALWVALATACSTLRDARADEEAAPQSIVHPQVIDTATARILPALVFYSGSGLDTAGTFSGIAIIGLGDVADFGVLSAEDPGGWLELLDGERSLLSNFSAQLRMGLDEDRLFAHQPAVALGFRKSFEREEDHYNHRVAELFLVASKRLGSRVSVHAGLSLWDALLLARGSDRPIFLHDRGLRAQLRPSFAVEVSPNPRAQLLFETRWAPQLRFEDETIDLAATFAFGARYALTDWALIESGVSVPEIGERDLLEAQIFARVRFVSLTLARPYRRSK